MKKLFSIVLILLMLVGILASCGNYESPDENPADTGSNDSKLGADTIISDNEKSTISQNYKCDCCKNNVSIAVLIAQTHFYETFNVKTDFGYYYLFEVIHEPNVFVEDIDDEYWYIMPELYQNGERADIMGGCQYVYVIKKSTGEISNLLIFAGE